MRRNRVLLGWSVREAADRAGISKNTILRIEAGLSAQKSSVEKLSRAFGMVAIDPSGPRPSALEGKHFKLQTRESEVWYATRVGEDGKARGFTNDEIQNSDERNRRGWYGLASHFGLPLRVRRDGSRIIPFLIEVYRKTDESRDESGERFILGIRGRIRVNVGDEAFEVGEGEAATYDGAQPNSIEPVEVVRPGQDAPVALQIVLPGSR